MRDWLECRQAQLYLAAVAVAAATAGWVDGTQQLQILINPALGLMLYLTFLQVPLGRLRAAFAQRRFLGALLLTNFVAIPLLVWSVSAWLPQDELLRLGVLLVLLAPCIDYVVTFAHMGKADARLLLAATPLLLLVQMALLPLYLGLLLGPHVVGLIQPQPFVSAFVWLIVVPLLLAWLTQRWAGRSPLGERVQDMLGVLPVPATALVLFVVIAAVLPQLGAARSAAWAVLPAYVAFAVLAPVVGWAVGKLFRLEPGALRAVVFSGSTRNALVVLPLALAIPGAMPVLPAVIVMQTLVELLSELIYVRVISRWR